MKKYLRILAAVLVGTMLLSTSALACTGVYVGKDVSDQGTYIIARSEDQAQSDYNKMFMVQPRVENVTPPPVLRFPCPTPPTNTPTCPTTPGVRTACTPAPAPTSTG